MEGPAAEYLGDWEGMVNVAIKEYGVEGPVLMGARYGDRSQVGVCKCYGLPAPGALPKDIVVVGRLQVCDWHDHCSIAGVPSEGRMVAASVHGLSGHQ